MSQNTVWSAGQRGYVYSQMCRYAFKTYKPHVACFACRKMFKRRLPSCDSSDKKSPLCPQCRLEMVDMGLDFRPPRSGDVKAWRVLTRLVDAGVSFHSCGCGGNGFVPEKSGEVAPFLERRIEATMAAMRAWAKDSTSNSEARLDAVQRLGFQLEKLRHARFLA